MLKLAYGLSFAELYERDGLVRLDAAFLDHLGAAESALRPQLEAARATASLDPKSESALILEIAPHLDDFLAERSPPATTSSPRSTQSSASSCSAARGTR